MTLKLLIVDDDAIIRKGLGKSIPWQQNGLEIVGTAPDGEKAWQIIQENKVDIVISDIRMPFLDGLELTELIQKNYPDIRTILLTGYEDFSYAKKAIKLHAYDYLLKPVDKSQLLETVKKAANDIKRKSQINVRLQESLPLLQKKFYENIVKGKLHIESINQQISELKIPMVEGLAAAFCLIPDSSVSDLEEYSSQFLEDICSENSSYFSIHAVAFSYSVDQTIIFLTTADKKKEEWEKELSIIAEKLRNKVQKKLLTTVTIGIGGIYDGIYGLHESYQEANAMANLRHMVGKNRVISSSVYSDIKRKENLEKIHLPNDQLLQHIQLGLVEEALHDIEEVFKELNSREYISLESARMVATELAIVAFKGRDSNEINFNNYISFLNQLHQKHTLQELLISLRTLIREICQSTFSKPLSQQQQTAHKAIEYIEKNFADENISLTEVAQAVHVSATYLSILLKQETSKTFSEYLLEFRMERAKKLLRTTDYTVASIAEQVGYNNSQYFSMCFKKFTGMTPAQFRSK